MNPKDIENFHREATRVTKDSFEAIRLALSPHKGSPAADKAISAILFVVQFCFSVPYSSEKLKKRLTPELDSTTELVNALSGLVDQKTFSLVQKHYARILQSTRGLIAAEEARSE